MFFGPAGTSAFERLFMSRKRLSFLLALFISIMSASPTASARGHNRAQKSRVHFLATATLLRVTWGMNQDIYLAELVSKKADSSKLVRIVDEYPEFTSPLSHDVLTDQAGDVLRLLRDDSCDIVYAGMHLRTAPGDPMALLHERLGYQLNLQKTPDPDELLSCYRIVRTI